MAFNFNFVKFEEKNVRLENRITITKSNSIGFPSKFYNDNKIKDFRFAVLFWDNANRAIGIKFTSEESEKGRFTIIHSKIGYGGMVVARSFFKTYGIDTQKYHGRYDWEKHTIEGVGETFVITLKEIKIEETKPE